jgi:hypothetical protein
MIIEVWKPEYLKIEGIRTLSHFTLVEIENMYDIGSQRYKVFYKCDGGINCKNLNKIFSINREHLNIKRSKTVNESVQICRSCQMRGENNPRYGDNRTWEDIMGKEKSDEMKSIYSERFISNNPSNDESAINNKISTNLSRWGVENVFQSEVIKNKLKETNLNKYGYEHPMQSDIIKENTKKTNLLKYGVDHVFQSEIIKDKGKKTNLLKYGVEHYSQSETSKKGVRERELEKYGVDNHTKSDNYRYDRFIITRDKDYIRYLENNISLFNCIEGHNFEIRSDNYLSRVKNNIPLCTVCNPIGDLKSIKEKELLEFIKNNYNGEVISNYRDGLEIDIYLPELKLGFEFNGLYFHSDKFKVKNYHLDKTTYFEDKGIKIIHIWEDEWVFKRIIMESQIINMLGGSKSIYARKCIVKEVNIKEVRKFLDDNHIQGYVNSVEKIGLYFEDELVSIMTFDHSEGRKKMSYGGWNLSRFCNKTDFNVIGGASKLLSYFIKSYNPKRIVSYANRDWSVGDLYYKLGFKNIGGNGPDYKYIIDNKRVHKSRYKKSKLDTDLSESEEMIKRKIIRIYDCGKIKFELNI